MAEKIATREAYGNALKALGEKNEKIVVLDADLSGSTKTAVFAKAFPERFFDCGIAEANMTSMAAGMAACGKIPFISTFAVFGTGRNYDVIRSSICYPKLNVKLAMTHAGLTVGEDGATHQSLEDIALMNALPNMTVIVPADAMQAEGAVFAAAEIEGPVYLRFSRAKTPVIYPEGHRFIPGKADIIKDGKDAAIFACGVMVSKAMEAAAALSNEGIEAAVINISTIKPLDRQTVITYARKCGRVVTAEEHSVFGGLNSVISQCLSEEYPVKVKAVAVKDVFGQSGKADELMEYYALTAGEIVKAVKSF
ncbi:MAG: transketolase family protein [Eubacteriaceae bacterium]|nr:transketolase family protein [Eubacteriaceae bacterium]